MHCRDVGAALLPVVGPRFVTGGGPPFVLILIVEVSRPRRRWSDLSFPFFFARRGVRDGRWPSARLSMFSIMSLLLYYSTSIAQSREGLGLTALEAGASLLPLRRGNCSRSGPYQAFLPWRPRVGLRKRPWLGGMALEFADRPSRHHPPWPFHLRAGMILLADRVLSNGRRPGRTLYALAPRLALSALSPAQAGQGFGGIVNACTFSWRQALALPAAPSRSRWGGFCRRAGDDLRSSALSAPVLSRGI